MFSTGYGSTHRVVSGVISASHYVINNFMYSISTPYVRLVFLLLLVYDIVISTPLVCLVLLLHIMYISRSVDSIVTYQLYFLYDLELLYMGHSLKLGTIWLMEAKSENIPNNSRKRFQITEPIFV